jgi:hypothetical protein
MSKSPAKNKNIFADFNPPSDISYTSSPDISPVNSAQNADKNTEKISAITPLPSLKTSEKISDTPLPFPENSPLP